MSECVRPRHCPDRRRERRLDTNPPACRLATRSDAAVELCSSIARPMPAAKPAKRLERRVASHERSASPNVRNMPVFTMYAPQTRSATALALCRRNVYTDQNPRKKGAAGASIVGLGPCRHDCGERSALETSSARQERRLFEASAARPRAAARRSGLRRMRPYRER